VRGKIRKTALMLSVIASLLALTFAAPPAWAVDPPSLEAPVIESGDVCTTIDVPIWVRDVVYDEGEGMLGYQFFLRWDTDILEAVTLTSEFPFDNEIGTDVDNAEGYLSMVYTMELPEPVGFAGDTIIATITFHVVGEGYSTLDLYNTIIMKVTGDPISHVAMDGFFINVPFEIYADLGRRKASVAHPTWHLRKYADNKLTGYVKNYGDVATKVMVMFTLSDGVTEVDLPTSEATVEPRKTVKISITLEPGDMFAGGGNYDVTAQAWYASTAGGPIDTPGIKIKHISLTFVP
jgi:hypothetical protein